MMSQRGLAASVVPALIVSCWVSFTWADSCRPGVALEGPPELLGPIAAALRRHGIGPQAGLGCPLLQVHVQHRGPVLELSIQEEVRRAERQVADTETAAIVIESFARSDISAPLLAARPGRARPAVKPADPPPAPAAEAPPLAASAATRFAVALDLEAAGGSEGSAWIGVALRACAQLGPVCVGALLRVAADPAIAMLDSGFMEGALITVQRTGVDALLGAEWPVHLPHVVLLPGIGFGVGWLRYDAGPYGSVDSGGLRVELRLGGAIPLYRGLALDLGLSLGAAFLGDTDPVLAVHDPDGSGHVDARSLSGPPWGYLRGGVGVRWGGAARSKGGSWP